MGKARPIWDITSGGVIIAAIIKIVTITYFLYFVRLSQVVIPRIVNKKIKTGNWKAKPNAKINFNIKDKYSFTLASN